MPGPHQVRDWLLDLENDIMLPTRCNNPNSNSSSITKVTNSPSTISRGPSTIILLLRNIIKW